MTEIELRNITKVYGSGASATTAVDGVSLTINPGELYFLLGPSGCGKTTLLRIVAGLVEPASGRVLFNGRDVTHLPVERRQTAMVFQNYALWPHMTVAQNVEFGPKMQGLPRPQRRALAQTNLARVQMESFARRRPNQLSGGQQQRVAVARALAAQGQCLLLDEPLSNLDARLRLHMRGQLRELVKATGTTAVYVTHDQAEALSMADRIAVMDAGRIAQVGAPQELYNRPASRFVADFLGEANFAAGRVVQAGPLAMIETPCGVFAAPQSHRLSVGTEVTCCVRPERIELSPSAAGAAGPAPQGVTQLAGRIDSSTYLGGLRQYLVRLTSASAVEPADGTVWKVTAVADASPLIAPGQQVTLTIRPQDVVALTE